MEGLPMLRHGSFSPSKDSNIASVPGRLSSTRILTPAERRLQKSKTIYLNPTKFAEAPQNPGAKACVLFALPDKAPLDAHVPDSAQQSPLKGGRESKRETKLQSCEGFSPSGSQDSPALPVEQTVSGKSPAVTRPFSSNRRCATEHFHSAQVSKDLENEEKLFLSQMGIVEIGGGGGESCQAFPQLVGLVSAGAFSLGPLPVEHLRSAAATLVLRPVVPHVVDALPILGPQGDHEVTARLHPGVDGLYKMGIRMSVLSHLLRDHRRGFTSGEIPRACTHLWRLGVPLIDIIKVLEDMPTVLHNSQFTQTLDALVDGGFEPTTAVGLLGRHPRIRRLPASAVAQIVEELKTGGVPPDTVASVLCRAPQALLMEAKVIRSRCMMLREAGLSISQVGAVIAACPAILSSQSNQALSCLKDAGVCGSALSEVILGNPPTLTQDAAKLRSVLSFLLTTVNLPASKLGVVLACVPSLLTEDVDSSLCPHLSFLRTLGFPPEDLGSAVAECPALLDGAEAERLLRLRTLGLAGSQLTKAFAQFPLLGQRHATWEEELLAQGVVPYRVPSLLQRGPGPVGGLVPLPEGLHFCFKPSEQSPGGDSNKAHPLGDHSQLLREEGLLGDLIPLPQETTRVQDGSCLVPRPHTAFLMGRGLQLRHISMLLVVCPEAYEVSLEGRLRPLFEELEGAGIGPQLVLHLLVQAPSLLHAPLGAIRQAISYLGMLGIPDHGITWLLCACPQLVADEGAQALLNLDFLRGLGLEAREVHILVCRHPRLLVKPLHWLESSRDRLLEWGLSSADIVQAVQRFPALLTMDLLSPSVTCSIQYLLEVIQQDVRETLTYAPNFLQRSLEGWIGPRTAYLLANGHRLPPVSHYIGWTEAAFCDYVSCPQEDFDIFRNEWQAREGPFWEVRKSLFS
eukprot:jgi/Botrbrau1/7390/Bobra.0316s0032.1